LLSKERNSSAMSRCFSSARLTSTVTV
jgi:hypothetical protein